MGPEGGVTSSRGRVQSGGTQGGEMVAEVMGMGPWLPNGSDPFSPQPQKDDAQGLLRSLETRVPAAPDTSPTGRRRRRETNVSGEEALDVSGTLGTLQGTEGGHLSQVPAGSPDVTDACQMLCPPPPLPLPLPLSSFYLFVRMVKKWPCCWGSALHTLLYPHWAIQVLSIAPLFIMHRALLSEKEP